MTPRAPRVRKVADKLWEASFHPAYQPLVLRAIERDATDIDVARVWEFLAEAIVPL